MSVRVFRLGGGVENSGGLVKVSREFLKLYDKGFIFGGFSSYIIRVVIGGYRLLRVFDIKLLVIRNESF